MIRILNLGCGVQSTTLFLMAHEGVIPPLDHAIFADTQDEPEAVYQHLAWLRTVPAPVPIIHVGTVGRLGDDLIAGRNSDGNRRKQPGRDGTTRFASIPAFTIAPGDQQEGRTRRQCTKEYKVEEIERIIRRDILGLRPRQRAPKEPVVEQLFGISWDERNRSISIRKRFERHGTPYGYSRPSFPLIEMRMSRWNCQDWLKSRVPHETPRSACVFCPFKSPEEWETTKKNPKDWKRAVEVDDGLRQLGSVANRGLVAELFVHRSCKPLPEVDIQSEADRARGRRSLPLFAALACEDGVCGV
jgi:hypothetical protein